MAGMGPDWGEYFPPPENGRTINCNFSHHGMVSGGGAEARNETLAEMVGAFHYIYPRDRSGACRSGYGGGDRDGGIGGRERVGYVSMEIGRIK